MEAIENNEHETIIGYLQAAQSEDEKSQLKNLLNSNAEQNISPFARTVHKFPQNQKEWGVVVLQMIMLGADVYAPYPSSHYTILERIQLYATGSYFEELTTYLFTVASANGDIKNLHFLFTHTTHLTSTLRTYRKKGFYLLLLQQIHLIQDTVEINSETTEKTIIINSQFVSQFPLTLAKLYPVIFALINILNSKYFTSTLDKRKWHFLMLALCSRALCIAKRIPIDDQNYKERKILFEQILANSCMIIPHVRNYFAAAYKELENPGLRKILERTHEINFSFDIKKQLQFLFSPLRLAAISLLKLHPYYPTASDGLTLHNNETSKIIFTETITLTDEEIYLIRKILHFAQKSTGLELSSLDDITVKQIRPLLDVYIAKTYEGPDVEDQQSTQPEIETDIATDNLSKTLYETTFGKLPQNIPVNRGEFRRFYHARKNEYESIETMQDKFSYAVKHNLTICIKTLIENNYFALEEEWVQQALFNAISQKNSDLAEAITEALPFLVFTIVDAERKTPWDLLAKLGDIETAQLVLKILTVIKNKLHIPGITLLPFAAAFGLIEIIEFLLNKYEKELITSDDIALAFKYAQEHHYYDISVKMLQNTTCLTKLKSFITPDAFIQFWIDTINTIDDMDGLNTIFNLVGIELKKIFLQNNLKIASPWVKQPSPDNKPIITENGWKCLIIQLKIKADSIKKSIEQQNINRELFEKITAEYEKIKPLHKTVSQNSPPATQPVNLTIPAASNRSRKQMSSEKQYESIEPYLDALVVSINRCNNERAYEQINQLHKIIEYKPPIALNKTDCQKLIIIIKEIINKIQHGQIKWSNLLIGIIKVAVKLNAINSEHSNEIMATLRYLLPEHEFKHIRHALILKNSKIRRKHLNNDSDDLFEKEIKVQEMLKVSSAKIETAHLDQQRSRSDSLNDQIQKSGTSIFDLQLADAALKAKQKSNVTPRWVNPEKWKEIYCTEVANHPGINPLTTNYYIEYRKAQDIIDKSKPEKLILIAVKYNMNMLAARLLKEKSHNMVDWDQDTKKAFERALDNINLAYCAKAFIEHLGPQYCQVLITDTTEQVSPLQLAEKNNNFVVQLALLKKIAEFRNTGATNDISVYHHAVIYKVPCTLRNCLSDQQIVQENNNAQTSAFELAISQQYIEGIFCFIEHGNNCFEHLNLQKILELFTIFIKLANATKDLASFNMLLNHLEKFKKHFSINGQHCHYSTRTWLSLFKCSLVLKALELVEILALDVIKLDQFITTIELNLNMPIIEKHLRQLYQMTSERLKLKNPIDKQILALQIVDNHHTVQTVYNLSTKKEHERNETVWYTKIPQIFLTAILHDELKSIQDFIDNTLTSNPGNIDTALEKAYSVAISCALEADQFKVFVAILQKLFVLVKTTPFYINLLRPYIKYILNNCRINYFEFLLQHDRLPEVHSQIIDHIDRDDLILFVSQEIDSADDVKKIYAIYNKINGIYKKLLLAEHVSQFHQKKYPLLQERLKEKLATIETSSTISADEFDCIITIFIPAKDTSSYFYAWFIQALQKCKTQIDFTIVHDQLVKWLKSLINNKSSNSYHLQQLVSARLAIDEKISALNLNQSEGLLIRSVIEDIALPTFSLPLNPIDKIIFCSNKMQLTAQRKTAHDELFDTPAQENLDQQYQVYPDILDKNSFELMTAIDTLLATYVIEPIMLSAAQKMLCNTIIILLEHNTKACHSLHKKLMKSVPLLIEFKINFFAAENLLNTAPDQAQQVEFDRKLFAKRIITEVFSELDHALIAMSINKFTEDQYYAALDSIIQLIDKGLTIHEANIQLLENVWQNLLDRLEQRVRDLVAKSYATSYTFSNIVINKNKAEQYWKNCFQQQFGLSATSETNDPDFYQKLFKQTMLDFSSLSSIKEQFDYCMKKQCIVKLHELVKQAPSLLSYAQLFDMLLLAVKLKAFATVMLLLVSICPFDLFTQKIAAGKTVWDSINEFADAEFIPAATIILSNIQYYISDNNISPLSLSIIFGMLRLSNHLLRTTKSFSEGDIKTAFQTAIFYRQYESVCSLIDCCYRQYPKAFKISENEFYEFLSDEVAQCDTAEKIMRFLAKAFIQYKVLSANNLKPRIFQENDNRWQEIINKIKLKLEELGLHETIMSKIMEQQARVSHSK